MSTSNRCAVCGSPNPKPLHVKRLDLVRCPDCEVVSSRAVPRPEELREAYQRFDAGELSRRSFDRYVAQAEQILLNEAKRSDLGSRDVTFLDYGCGGGHFVAAAGKLGWKAFGMEYDAYSAGWGRDHGLEVFEGIMPQGDAVLGGLTFDVIKCMHVLEHVPSPLLVVQALVRRLKPGGFLLIGVPDQDSVPSRLKIGLRAVGIKTGEYGFVQPPIHLHGFTKKSLDALGAAAGLRTAWSIKSSPLDSATFPTTPDYWSALRVQEAVYQIGRVLSSPGHLSCALTTK